MTHRIGTVTYSTSQGISHLAKWFFDAGVITDVMTFRHGSRPLHPEWYPKGTIELVGRPFNGPAVDAWLKPLDAVVFFETPFDDQFYTYCRVRGVKTVLVPMYECYPRTPRGLPNKFICPSKLDQRNYWPGSPFLQIPVPPGIVWKQRTKAERFLHNGGNLGLRGHKGTLEILKAWEHVKSPAILTIRAQDTVGLGRLLTVANVKADPRVSIIPGDAPYEDLFSGYDVFIMAEKYNGLSLPLIEARAAGMLVMTSDRFPMNDWLPTKVICPRCDGTGEYAYGNDENGVVSWACRCDDGFINPLIPVKSYSKQCVSGAYQMYDEALVTPEAIAETVDRVFGSDLTQYSLDGKTWAKENSWKNLKDQWIQEILR